MGVIISETIKPLITGRPMRAERLLKAAIAIARERERLCFSEADRYRKEGKDREAGTEQCAGMEARHIGDLLEKLVPAKTR